MTFLEKLEQLKSSLPMHMPGHKRNVELAPYLKKLAANLDITEIYNCDCLHHADGIIKDAMQRASNLWGAKNSYLLINGSTCGILAGVHACTKRGDTVLMARACHKSVYNAIELCGLKAEYLTQEQMPEGYSKCVNPIQIKDKLSKRG